MSEKMLVEPKIMKNICINAHPVGAEKLIESQINYLKHNSIEKTGSSPQNALIIGGSAGYGLASRIVAAFGYGARTLSVAFEAAANPRKKRTATVGWYNTKAFEKEAEKKGLWYSSLYGDAFSKEVKQESMDIARKELGKIDLVIYSLAAPKRTDPETGETYISTLKPIGKEYHGKYINVVDAAMSDVVLPPASDEEIANTVRVMGGEDWELWTRALVEADLLAENSLNIAFSYIGPELTEALYRKGTIGRAKEDLESTAHRIDTLMQQSGTGRCYISVNKALVTRASSVIPTVPLYLAVLYKVMKAAGKHETCIEQMRRLFTQRLYSNAAAIKTDEQQRIRMDDWELSEDIQSRVRELWNELEPENIDRKTDIQGFRKEFYNIHGFMWDEIDYSIEVTI